MTVPADIANRSLDAAGADFVIGDIEEGGKVSEIVRRAYVPARQQLLRAAHWRFARRMSKLALLGDRWGQIEGVGTQVVEPWRFEYQYPIDCVQAQFVPVSRHVGGNHGAPGLVPAGQIVLQGVPPPGTNTDYGRRRSLRPARFLIAVDPNYPGVTGAITDWSQLPSLQNIIGVGSTARTVVLTDECEAELVYTADIEYPDEWDAGFQEGMVAFLASKIALPVAIALDRDKKFGVELRDRAIATAKGVIADARAANANEGFSKTDHLPDWIAVRFSGAGFDGYGSFAGDSDGGGADGGVFGYSHGSVGFSDGSSY